MTSMIRSLSASLLITALLSFSGNIQALLSKHECGFCHSLHGSDTGFVPRSDSINLEVLCMGCHLTANGTTAAVQPHRSDGTYAEHYITCSDCHDVHDNVPNWRLNDPNHAADDDAAGRDGTDIRPDGWTVGINTKMVGRRDPDGATPYAIIITKEADFDKDGVPDREAVVETPSCDVAILNDCYVTNKRHVIFENRDVTDPLSTIHGWADGNEDNMAPADATAWGETLPDWDDPEGAPMDAMCNMCHLQTAKNRCSYTGARCDTHKTTETCTTCHTHAGCFDKGGVCTKWAMPDRDLRMDAVSAAPVAVNSGQIVTIAADFTNLGDAIELVRVKFYSSIEGYLGSIDVSDVAPGGGTGQAILNWLTTTEGTHTVSAEIQPVLAEVNVTNNAATGNTVIVGILDIHDVAVRAVTAPPGVEVNSTATVSVDISNEGGYTETFNVTLASDINGTIQTLSSGALAVGASTTLDFSWNTTGASIGTHTLEAVAATIPGETITGNNSADTTSEVVVPSEVHDVAVTLVDAPASATKPTSVTVSVTVENQGTASETFNVILTSDQPNDGSLPMTQPVTLSAAGSTVLNFTWALRRNDTDSTTHTLTATADTVPGEVDTGDNSSTDTIIIN